MIIRDLGSGVENAPNFHRNKILIPISSCFLFIEFP